MATRRPVTSSLDHAVPHGTPPGLALAGLALAGLAMGLGLATGLGLAPAPAMAQYMALTAPRPAAPEPPKPALPAALPAQHALNGQLPNQRTNPGRQRVVRDICIGCDR